ncbi:integrase-like protein [Actinomycetospora cinnamomea]|uniref:Integrase-like protein n=1 Tax=Actinomycetospora cinnamomea TaxID=663609 RepID=A0A2U1E684_9PSEU|nr:integrase-like protein [Actinomycetospora cinnamomea]
MALWQLDIVGGVFLADGREVKIVSGIDDHSRYVVIAALVVVPTGRAVSEASLAAVERYGVPGEVLTDNGKQFTGRYTRPAPVEVLFERVCRERGITARLTKRRSPTTTGKIERFHQTLRGELLDQESGHGLPGRPVPPERHATRSRPRCPRARRAHRTRLVFVHGVVLVGDADGHGRTGRRGGARGAGPGLRQCRVRRPSQLWLGPAYAAVSSLCGPTSTPCTSASRTGSGRPCPALPEMECS